MFGVWVLFSDVCCLLFGVCCLSFVECRSMFIVVCCLMLAVVCCSLFVVRCLMFVGRFRAGCLALCVLGCVCWRCVTRVVCLVFYVCGSLVVIRWLLRFVRCFPGC